MDLDDYCKRRVSAQAEWVADARSKGEEEPLVMVIVMLDCVDTISFSLLCHPIFKSFMTRTASLPMDAFGWRQTFAQLYVTSHLSDFFLAYVGIDYSTGTVQ